MPNYRDATTGQYTTADYAAARPAETVAETVEARHETPDLAELRRLAEAATPGPWEAFGAVDGRRGERWLGVTTDMRAIESARAGDVFAAQNCTRQDALFIAAANPAVVLGLLDHLAHMREARDNARDAAERLEAILDGRCLSDITHRDEGHRQSVCMLPEGHAPLMHDDCTGCTWTDAAHWQQSAVDRVADEVQRIVDESQHEGWDGPLVRILVGRISAALEGSA